MNLPAREAESELKPDQIDRSKSSPSRSGEYLPPLRRTSPRRTSQPSRHWSDLPKFLVVEEKTIPILPTMDQTPKLFEFSELPLDRLTLRSSISSGATRAFPIGVEGFSQNVGWRLPPLRVKWEPSNPIGSTDTRVSLCMEPTGEVEAWYTRLDHVILRLAAANSDLIWQRRRSPQDLALSYQSCLNRTAKGSYIKTRVNKTGKYETQIWDASESTVPWPAVWRNHDCQTSQVMSSLWVSGSKWGVAISTQDAILNEIPEMPKIRSFPFRRSAQPEISGTE